MPAVRGHPRRDCLMGDRAEQRDRDQPVNDEQSGGQKRPPRLDQTFIT